MDLEDKILSVKEFPEIAGRTPFGRIRPRYGLQVVIDMTEGDVCQRRGHGPQ